MFFFIRPKWRISREINDFKYLNTTIHFTFLVRQNIKHLEEDIRQKAQIQKKAPKIIYLISYKVFIQCKVFLSIICRKSYKQEDTNVVNLPIEPCMIRIISKSQPRMGQVVPSWNDLLERTKLKLEFFDDIFFFSIASTLSMVPLSITTTPTNNRAETETQVRLEKVADIKGIDEHLVALKREINKVSGKPTGSISLN